MNNTMVTVCLLPIGSLNTKRRQDKDGEKEIQGIKNRYQKQTFMLYTLNSPVYLYYISIKLGKKPKSDLTAP